MSKNTILLNQLAKIFNMTSQKFKRYAFCHGGYINNCIYKNPDLISFWEQEFFLHLEEDVNKLSDEEINDILNNKGNYMTVEKINKIKENIDEMNFFMYNSLSDEMKEQIKSIFKALKEGKDWSL